MKERRTGTFWLSLPYLFALLVVGLMVYGHLRRSAGSNARVGLSSAPGTAIDPVCGMTVGGGIRVDHEAAIYLFCTAQCRELFVADPQRYLAEGCLVCRSSGVFTPVSGEEFALTWQGDTYHFCSDAHRGEFRSDPAGQFMHTMWGIPAWLYYASIAAVLVVSFGLFEWRSPGQGVAANSEGRSSPRLDLLRWRPLRALLRHPMTRFVTQLAFLAAFLMIIVAGLFGNQLPGKNVAPLLTWTVWWGGLILLILYLGKAWCYVCPWNAIADWAEGLRAWGRRKSGLSLELKWPRWMRNIWPATLLFVGLTWIELGFGVTMNPRFTAWLALGMLGMAFVCAFIFDRKAFCRYGCLVGRVSGMYALFAPIEVRARDKDVCRTCTSKACFRGSDAGDACPTSEFLGSMKQNTYCISCMECVKTCDHDNVALNLRPWGSDLGMHVRPRSDEAYLALLMLAMTGFHGLTMTGSWQRVVDWIEGVYAGGEIIAFSLGMVIVMLMPILMYAGLVAISYWMARESSVGYRNYFIRYAYAVLPIALFYHLAHNSEHLLMEGQKVIALLSDPMGSGWNLFGTAGWDLAPLVDLPTLWIIQVLCVLVGHVYSLWVARRMVADLFQTRGAALRSQLPMLVAMILFSLMSLWLLKQPMQMRSSAM